MTYLKLDAVDDNLLIPNTITFDRVVYDVYLYSEANGTDFAGRLIDTSVSPFQIRGDKFTFQPTGTTGAVIGQRTVLSFPVTRYTGSGVSILGYSSAPGYYAVKADLFDVKLYDGETLVAHYDMSTGTIEDKSGNGNHATLTGGEWVYEQSDKTIVYDDFNRPDSQTLGSTITGHEWKSVGTSSNPPPFGIIEGRAYNPNTTPDARTVIKLGESTGIKVGVDILTSTTMTLLTLRQRPNDSSQACYLWGVSGSNLLFQIRGGSGGGITTLYSSGWSAQGFQLPMRIEAYLKGETIECYANGKLITTIQDTEHTNNTEHGLWQHYNSSARFDNFAIDSLDVAPPLVDLTGTSSSSSTSGTASLRRSRNLAGTTSNESTAVGSLDIESGTIIEELSGSSLSESTASGTLRRSYRVTGSTTATSTESALMDAEARMTGASSSSSASSGSLRRHRELTGATSNESTASGSLSVDALTIEALSGSSMSLSTASGALDKAFTLNGASGQGSTAAGQLRRLRDVTGATTAASYTQGTLKASARLEGASSSASEASGHFTTIIEVEGSSSSASTATGELSRLQKLTGSSISASMASGSVDSKGEISLHGSSLSQSSADGILKADSKMTGASTQESNASGTLDAQLLYFAGSSISASTAEGTMRRKRGIRGSSESGTTTGGQMKRSRRMAGASTARSTSSGSLGVIMWISGASTSTSKASGHMIMAVALLVPKTHLEGLWRHRTEMNGSRNIESHIEGTQRTKTNLKGVF